MIVHQLVLCGRQHEYLRENRINGDIFGLPGRLVTGGVTQLVERSSPLDKRVWGPEAVYFNKELRGCSTIEVQQIDRVNASVTEKTGGNVGGSRNGLVM